MILVGIDDTDTKTSPGTNQVARSIVADLGGEFHCRRIVRHQLLVDPRVPYTSKNSCCSLLLDVCSPSMTLEQAMAIVQNRMRTLLRKRFQPGSDPGLCVVAHVPESLTAFGRLCQVEVTGQASARKLAHETGSWLEGLGGTEDGVVGALAAVGLAATGDDGRIVQIDQRPDDLSGWHELAVLAQRGVEHVSCQGIEVKQGVVDVGKHLRPNLRAGRVELFVEPTDVEYRWRAVRKL